MTTYRRRPEQEPEVREFHNGSTHQQNMIEGHELAAWAHRCGKVASRRMKSASVRPADNGMEKNGVHVIGRSEVRGAAMFVIHPGEFLVWENEEFRVYSAVDFNEIFTAMPEVTPNRHAPDNGYKVADARSGISIQRDGV